MLLSSERGEWAWPGAVDEKSTLCMDHMWTQGQHMVKGGCMGVLTAWIFPMVTILPLRTALHSCFCRKERGQALTGSRISRPELSGRDFNQIPGSWDFLGQDFIIFLSHDFIIAPFSFGFFSYCCIIAFFFVGWFHISLLGRCINFSIVDNENNQRSTKTLHYYTKNKGGWRISATRSLLCSWNKRKDRVGWRWQEQAVERWIGQNAQYTVSFLSLIIRKTRNISRDLSLKP